MTSLTVSTIVYPQPTTSATVELSTNQALVDPPKRMFLITNNFDHLYKANAYPNTIQQLTALLSNTFFRLKHTATQSINNITISILAFTLATCTTLSVNFQQRLTSNFNNMGN